ncbi:hypothetical protein [Actinophytocola sp. KF-1]
MVSGNTEGTITTGGFSYDEVTLGELIKEWLALADDYDRSFQNSQRLTIVEGPGLDFASAGVANAANSYGTAYLAYLKQNEKYCIDQAQLYQNALDDYLGVEHRNVEELYKTTGSTSVSSGQEI